MGPGRGLGQNSPTRPPEGNFRAFLVPGQKKTKKTSRKPFGSAKRCPPPKAARSAAPSDRPKSLSAEGAIGELARHMPSTSQQKHGLSLHG